MYWCKVILLCLIPVRKWRAVKMYRKEAQHPPWTNCYNHRIHPGARDTPVTTGTMPVVKPKGQNLPTLCPSKAGMGHQEGPWVRTPLGQWLGRRIGFRYTLSLYTHRVCLPVVILCILLSWLDQYLLTSAWHCHIWNCKCNVLFCLVIIVQIFSEFSYLHYKVTEPSIFC